MSINWPEIKLDSDPILVVLIRGDQRQLTGRRVSIDQNVFDELRQVAQATADRAVQMDAVPYTPYVGLDENEYLTLARSLLVPKSTSKQTTEANADASADETVGLLGIVDRAEYWPSMGAGAVQSVPEDAFAGQAICFGDGQSRIGFVTRTNPRKVLKRSLIPLGKADDNDRLKRVTSPELVLEPIVHAVVTTEELAIFNQTQFQFLVTDATLLADRVPTQVTAIGTAFQSRGIVLSASTISALTARAQRQPRVARRLAAFAERIDHINLKALKTGKGFKTQDLKPDDFVNAAGELECIPERVVEMLDALEGRFFKDAFSPEKRRADRFRPRRP